MVTATTDTTDLPVPVREEPHWRVVIHPGSYEKERISSLAECWSIMERSRVGWRHPEYPIIGREEERDEGEDWIASSVDYGVQREYWRLYRSGQFVHLRGFWLERREHDAAMSAFAERHPSETSPCGHIDFNTLVRTPLEIFTFAGRLGIARALDYNPVIEVAMNGLDGRVLLTTDPWRGEPRGIHRARERPSLTRGRLLCWTLRHPQRHWLLRRRGHFSRTSSTPPQARNKSRGTRRDSSTTSGCAASRALR